MKTFSRTKIIATVGPACSSSEGIGKLIEAGVNVFRLNFSHGEHIQKAEVIQRIREYNDTYNHNVGILADLQGPKIRLGKIESEHFEVKEGDEFTITTDEIIGSSERVSITYDHFPADVKAGDKLLVDDGKMELTVLKSDGKKEVRVQATLDGVISSSKGVNLPDTAISLPSLTEKDKKDLAFALEQGVDWIALSFVRSEQDIIGLREHINTLSKEKQDYKQVKIVAKIEKPQAVENIDAIMQQTDAIMIARGDLGVEMRMQDVPLIQKHIVKKCLLAAKPVIIATQMMESMIDNPKPTRAEVTDVANAIIDGADAVMLSGETAVGKYPVIVVESMKKIIVRVEEEDSIYFKRHLADETSPTFLSDAVCYTACNLAEAVNANGIIGMTRSGYTAYMCSSCRPKAYVYVFTDNRRLLSRLSLVWGVNGFFYDRRVSTDDTIASVQQYLVDNGFLSDGDVVVNMASMPIRQQGRTNTVKVTKIGA